MNAQKLTQKSLEALQEAQSIASRNSNQAVGFAFTGKRSCAAAFCKNGYRP